MSYMCCLYANCINRPNRFYWIQKLGQFVPLCLEHVPNNQIASDLDATRRKIRNSQDKDYPCGKRKRSKLGWKLSLGQDLNV